ncbi:prepilin-type N-terminal cleavage/methylation domain-containing protein [Pelomonas sp. SE-A7]|uniref:pilus assembly FimT family protein n=1 Tax=Pelomonas sp. SE-A7 TaxID=3054953 RepID=UPI00259C6FF1|nr:prepilin-type N-terminal cleavage/methylation domain-containing protein [Pelomonas sp. SE-A7]MDM4765108.1 prepilin-type N-terminal cleavage/methylation domain-containing protein [Pelomonas sp. SE-A7]
MSKHPQPRGITLVEMLVVLAVLGILMAVAAPSIADMIARRRVQMVAAELTTNLAYARSEAGARPMPMLISFGSGSTGSCYTLFIKGNRGGNCNCALGVGNACSARGSNNVEFKTVVIPNSTGTSISANVVAAQFNSPQMTVTPADVSITVTNHRVGALRLDLGLMGRVASCSPDGSIPGVIRCPS